MLQSNLPKVDEKKEIEIEPEEIVVTKLTKRQEKLEQLKKESEMQNKSKFLSAKRVGKKFYLLKIIQIEH